MQIKKEEKRIFYDTKVNIKANIIKMNIYQK